MNPDDLTPKAGYRGFIFAPHQMMLDGLTGVYAPVDLVIACQNARIQERIDSEEKERARERKASEERAAQIIARRKAAQEAAEEKERKVQDRIERNRRLKEREEAVRQIEEEAEREDWDASVKRFRLLDLD